MSDKKKINLGFDIGIASVGWSIIDEDYNILDMGTRLFDDPAGDGDLGNNTRRKSRELRRQLRRSRKRKDDLIYFFIKNNLVKDEEEFYRIINQPLYKINQYANTILDLKVKGLNEILTTPELLIVLFHYLSNRGIFYKTIGQEEDPTTKKEIDAESIKYQPNIFPSVQLKQFSDKYGWYKAVPYRTQIPHDAYIKEVEELLGVQNKTPEFINDYLAIFNRMRSYKVGPGSQKSPTPYGLYREQYSKQDKKVEIECVGTNLWDYTTGKCTVYPEELRGAKYAPIAEIFNLLNELNNLTISHKENQTKLTAQNKMDLFQEIQNKWLEKDSQMNAIINSLAKLLWPKDFKLHIHDISGFKQTNYKTKNDSTKADFQNLNNYFFTVKFLLKTSIIKAEDIKILDLDFLTFVNNIFEKVRENQNPKDAYEAIKKYLRDNNLDTTHIDFENCNDYFKSLKRVSGTHSLSYKAMKEYISFGINNSENQMYYFAEKIKNNEQTLFKNHSITKYIPTGLFDKEIISPTTRRAFNQSVAILNKIIKRYSKTYNLENITIELARDKNSKEDAKTIRDIQDSNRKILEDVIDQIDSSAKTVLEKKNNYETRRKLKLLKAQNGLDIYDNQLISYNDLLLNPQKYDIDHVIPFSISGDNSLNNTVITKKENNAAKGNKTPYIWLNSLGRWQDFEKRVKTNQSFSKTKKSNLLYLDDPSKNALEFINRNLVDTRYASRLVLNIFQDFFSMHKKDTYPGDNSFYVNAKVKVLNGAITHYARYNLFNQDKDRDYNYHHAIDATIMCFVGMNPNIKRTLENNYSFDRAMNRLYKKDSDISSNLIDEETGEIFSKTKLYDKSLPIVKFVDDQMNDFKDNKNEKSVKYSRLIKTRNNISLANQTIYSFKWKNETEGQIINKLDLLGIDKTTMGNLTKYFSEDSEEKDLHNLIIFNQNKSLYEKLKTIYKQYINPKKTNNPFVDFMNEQEPTIKKHKYVSIGNNQVVRKIKINGNEKTIDNIIVLKKHNNKGIMEKLNPLSVRIYKNNKNKLVLLPINQKVLSFKDNKMHIDEIKVKNILTNNLKVNDIEKFLVIKNGTLLLNLTTRELFWCNGGGNFKQNKIEIKTLYKEQKEQTNVAINTISNNFLVIETDILGQIWKATNIKKFFNL